MSVELVMYEEGTNTSICTRTCFYLAAKRIAQLLTYVSPQNVKIEGDALC